MNRSYRRHIVKRNAWKLPLILILTSCAFYSCIPTVATILGLVALSYKQNAAFRPVIGCFSEPFRPRCVLTTLTIAPSQDELSRKQNGGGHLGLVDLVLWVDSSLGNPIFLIDFLNLLTANFILLIGNFIFLTGKYHLPIRKFEFVPYKTGFLCKRSGFASRVAFRSCVFPPSNAERLHT